METKIIPFGTTVLNAHSYWFKIEDSSIDGSSRVITISNTPPGAGGRASVTTGRKPGGTNILQKGTENPTSGTLSRANLHVLRLCLPR